MIYKITISLSSKHYPDDTPWFLNPANWGSGSAWEMMWVFGFYQSDFEGGLCLVVKFKRFKWWWGWWKQGNAKKYLFMPVQSNPTFAMSASKGNTYIGKYGSKLYLLNVAKIINVKTNVSPSSCFDNTTSAPDPWTLKPSSSVGNDLTFCALRSATISSVRNSTSSRSPKVITISYTIISHTISYTIIHSWN